MPYGLHRGEVRIEPHDDLPQDDSYRFSIARSDTRKVLFLSRQRSDFYFKAALESAPASGLTLQSSSVEQAPEDLSHYAFIVLNDLGDLNPAFERHVADYVSHGGAALVAVGERAAASGTVPITKQEVARTPQVQTAEMFPNVQFTGAPRITVASADRVQAKFADGSPLLIEHPFGEGRVLVFASALDNSSGDLPLHTSFLPFVAQTGMYLSGADDTPSSVVAGSPISLRRARTQSTAADVIGPDGKHALSLNEATRAMTYDAQREGFYEVQRANGQRVLIAVNADRRESDLSQVPADTLALWRNTGSTDTSDPGGAGEEQKVPFSFWRYILILALVAAAAESVFAGRYLREKREAR